MTKTAWAVLTLVMAGAVTAGESDKAAPSGQSWPQFATQRAIGNRDIDSDFWTFQVRSFTYSIMRDGRGSRRGVGSAPLSFQLMLTKGDWVEAVSYVPLGRDLCLIYGYTDGEGAAGRVVRLDGGSLKARWTAHVPGFNLGDAVVEGQYLYLTAIGFVAKLDLMTGRYVWQHDGLYAAGHFNAFERPEVGETVVVFREISHDRLIGPPRAVSVQKQTGERVPK